MLCWTHEPEAPLGLLDDRGHRCQAVAAAKSLKKSVSLILSTSSVVSSLISSLKASRVPAASFREQLQMVRLHLQVFARAELGLPPALGLVKLQECALLSIQLWLRLQALQQSLHSRCMRGRGRGALRDDRRIIDRVCRLGSHGVVHRCR